VVVLWLGSLLLSFVGKHKIWSYHGWVCRCRQSVNTICVRILIRFIVVVVWSVTIYVVVLWLGLSLFSSVSKHKMWSYYDRVYCCCHSSVNKICGRIMVGFIVAVVR